MVDIRASCCSTEADATPVVVDTFGLECTGVVDESDGICSGSVVLLFVFSSGFVSVFVRVACELEIYTDDCGFSIVVGVDSMVVAGPDCWDSASQIVAGVVPQPSPTHEELALLAELGVGIEGTN